MTDREDLQRRAEQGITDVLAHNHSEPALQAAEVIRDLLSQLQAVEAERDAAVKASARSNRLHDATCFVRPELEALADLRARLGEIEKQMRKGIVHVPPSFSAKYNEGWSDGRKASAAQIAALLDPVLSAEKGS